MSGPIEDGANAKSGVPPLSIDEALAKLEAERASSATSRGRRGSLKQNDAGRPAKAEGDSEGGEEMVPIIRRFVLLGVLAVAGSTFVGAQASRFHTTRAVEFRLAEDEPAPGLVPVHVNGETRIIYVHPEVQLDDRDIRSASVAKDEAGQPAVQVHLRPSGVKKLNALMKANQRKMVAIASKDKVMTAPIIEGTELVDDMLDINGGFTAAEASALAKALSK